MKKLFYKLYLLSFLLVMLCINATAQVLTSIKQEFDSYQQTSFQEKIFVHADKESYLTGELLWFKLYYLNENSSQPYNLSKVAYVDVLDNENNSLLQSKIAIREGSGNGSLYIPSTALTGTYKLRAYTNWMKNAGPDVFFEKQITIINPLIAPKKAQEVKADYSLQFYPEGGDMIAGISSKVGFKATDKQGNSIEVNGIIVNQKNETVAEFKTAKFGIGHFTFTPIAENTYQAIVNSNNRLIHKNLPPVKNQGYAISVSDPGTGSISVIINYSLSSSDPVYLVVSNQNKINYAESILKAKGLTKLAIEKIKLNDGISSFTLFNSSGQLVCERLYFKRPDRKLIIEASSDLSQYKRRQKVNITIATKNEKGKPQPTDLSISVHQLDSLQSASQAGIASYIWLGSELKGRIESADYYFLNEDKESNEALDNLMLTHGWRHFDWDNILTHREPVLKFLPEINGHLITGKITDINSKPVQNTIIHMGIRGKRVQYVGAKSDSLGNYLFNTKDFYGLNEIILQTSYGTDSNYRISIQSPFYEQFSYSKFPEFTVKPTLINSIARLNINTQVQKIYYANKPELFYYPGIDSTAFYGKPHKTYKLSDYTRFPTMEEVLREYISEVNVVKQQKHFHIKMINDTRSLGGDPLVLLDGVPYFDMDRVLSIDPLKLEKIDVVNNIYFWGPTKSYGILNFSTLKGDMNGIQIDPHALILDYEGMQLQREFYSPEYEMEPKKNSRIPDFRNVLYWSPQLITDSQEMKNISFFTSDQPGTYIAVIQGLTQEGTPASKTFTFNVTK